MRKHVVQNVDPHNCGGTQTTTGALYSYDAYIVGLNGLNEPHTYPSSQMSRATVAQRVFSTLAQGRNFLWERSELRKSSRRGDNQSPILVIYQLLLKNNTKYWVSFERNCRGRWSS